MLWTISLAAATATEFSDIAVIDAPPAWDPAPDTAVDRVPGMEGLQIEVHVTALDGPSFALWTEGLDPHGAPVHIRLATGDGEVWLVTDGCGAPAVWAGAGSDAAVLVLDLDGGVASLDAYSLAVDADADGLTDGYEAGWACSDPSDPDTDDDGLGDREESDQGCSPTASDSDLGGVPDFEEVYRYGSSCRVTTDDDPALGADDLDGDGLSNDDEYAAGTSIWTADVDGDGLTDADEAAWGTDPWDGDTDGGGTSDGEAKWGADPLDPIDDEGLAYAEFGDISLINECDLVTDGWATPIPEELTSEELAAYEAELAAHEAEQAAWDAYCEDARARHARDTDGDGVTDYDEVFLWYSDPFVVDTDGDGLSDAAETSGSGNPSDPTRPDTDGDGLLDPEEVALGTLASFADYDGDGLDDGEELAVGTDPHVTDTDGGGARDGELRYGGDPFDPTDDAPLLADPDGDGVRTWAELAAGCDPEDADTDDDGLDDHRERWEGACADTDLDDDGWSDFVEARESTDSSNAADHP